MFHLLSNRIFQKHFVNGKQPQKALSLTTIRYKKDVEDSEEGAGYFLIRGKWGCAAGWGRIFTTGLTIVALHFPYSYLSGVAHFRIFGGKKVLHIYGLQTYQNVCTVDEK